MRTCLLVIVLSVALFLMSAPGATAQHYSAWSTPTVFDEVNTSSALEFASAISKDDLSFYLQRGDVTMSGEDIWVVRRRIELGVGAGVASRDHDDDASVPDHLNGRIEQIRGVAFGHARHERQVDHADVIRRRVGGDPAESRVPG